MRKELRPLTVVDQLRALPDGSVVLDGSDNAWQKRAQVDGWCAAQESGWNIASMTSAALEEMLGPVVVVYESEKPDA